MVPSLKLTYHLKINPWKRRFLLECIPSHVFCFEGTFYSLYSSKILHISCVVTGSPKRAVWGPSNTAGQYDWKNLQDWAGLGLEGSINSYIDMVRDIYIYLFIYTYT